MAEIANGTPSNPKIAEKERFGLARRLERHIQRKTISGLMEPLSVAGHESWF